MGYIIDWLKKFMFRVLLMDCWSLYILDTEKKIVMVLDPTETDPSDEMKRKHEALARKFQFGSAPFSVTCLVQVWLRPLDGHLCTCWWRNMSRAAGVCDCFEHTQVVSLIKFACIIPNNCVVCSHGRQWSVCRALHHGVQRSLPTVNSDPGLEPPKLFLECKIPKGRLDLRN